MKKKGIVVVVLCLIALVGCQKVIDIPLNEADQTLVVEAVLKDHLGDNYIVLSRSGSVYDDGEFERILDATVKVTDSNGGEFLFAHQGEGVYNCPDLIVEVNTVYDLKVQAVGQVITSSYVTQTKPKVDSLTYFDLAGIFGIPEDDTTYLISFHSVENGAEVNQYLLKIFRNGEVNDGYYLGNDDFINGQYYEAQFFGSEADPGDTVLVEMLSLDNANYNYFVGLSNNLSDGPFSAAPANPPTNLEGGALGYFGAYLTDTISIVLPG